MWAKEDNRIASPITNLDRRCWRRLWPPEPSLPDIQVLLKHSWASFPPYRVASTVAGAPAGSRTGDISKSLWGTAELGGCQEQGWPGDSDEWNELVLGVQFLSRGDSEDRHISTWFCSGITYREESPHGTEQKGTTTHFQLMLRENGWKVWVKTRHTVREKDLRIEIGFI